MTKRLLLIIALVVAVTASAAAYYRASRTAGAPTLTTATVSRGDVVETVNATGTLQAVTTVQVGTQVSGTIKALYADFNSRVRKGQIVAELEPSLLQTQVDQAAATVARLEADVERARVQVDDTQLKLKRAQELWDRQLIAATDLDTARTNARDAEASVKAAQAQVTQARASLNQNQVTLGHTIIRAPIDGIVISRSVDVGQTVAASTQAPTLFVIAQDLTQMKVDASVDESDIGRIHNGQPVTFRVDAYPNDTFTGTVSQVRLDPVTEQNVVSYVTVIDVSNPDLKLKPGMTANVTLEVARAEDVVRVPAAALRFRPTAEVFAKLGQQAPEPSPRAAGQSRPAPSGTPANAQARPSSGSADRGRVWVLADNRLQPVPVRVGVTDGASTAILDGQLQEGAEVVTNITAASSTTAAGTGGSPLIPRFGGNRAGGGAGAGQRAGGQR